MTRERPHVREAVVRGAAAQPIAADENGMKQEVLHECPESLPLGRDGGHSGRCP
jgi:hypothetical protein